MPGYGLTAVPCRRVAASEIDIPLAFVQKIPADLMSSGDFPLPVTASVFSERPFECHCAFPALAVGSILPPVGLAIPLTVGRALPPLALAVSAGRLPSGFICKR